MGHWIMLKQFDSSLSVSTDFDNCMRLRPLSTASLDHDAIKCEFWSNLLLPRISSFLTVNTA